nr:MULTISPECIES: DUF3306 domain-containing protein [unclassified Vibrio]
MVAKVSCWRVKLKSARAQGEPVASSTFFHRWSKRKLNQEEEKQPLQATFKSDASRLASASRDDRSDDNAVQTVAVDDPNPSRITKEEGTLSSLLLSQASQEIKKTALRELFFNGDFNQRDQLDDYDDDYHDQTNLASEISKTLREWLDETQTSTDQLAKISKEPSSSQGQAEEAKLPSSLLPEHEAKQNIL